MSAPRFYCPGKLSPGAHCKLPEAVSRHAIKALRLKVGDALCLFNGEGGEFSATLERVQKDEAVAMIHTWQDRELESPCQIKLVQALQAADKMDYTLQKSVELGISAIQPVVSRRSVVRLSGDRETKRVQHWQGIVTSACEQCGRNTIPEVSPVADLLSWLATPPSNPQALRLMLAPGATITLAEALLPNHPTQSSLAPPIELLIGTEGGLDPAEITAAQGCGFIPVALGPRILRTETAGLAALAAIQTLWGDFRPASHARHVP